MLFINVSAVDNIWCIIKDEAIYIVLCQKPCQIWKKQLYCFIFSIIISQSTGNLLLTGWLVLSKVLEVASIPFIKSLLRGWNSVMDDVNKNAYVHLVRLLHQVLEIVWITKFAGNCKQIYGLVYVLLCILFIFL